jgi:hypothetical protein
MKALAAHDMDLISRAQKWTESSVRNTEILEQISRYRCGVDSDSVQFFFGIDFHFIFFFTFFPNFSGASHQSWGAICDKLVDPAECGVSIRRTYLTYLFTYTPFVYCVV